MLVSSSKYISEKLDPRSHHFEVVVQLQNVVVVHLLEKRRVDFRGDVLCAVFRGRNEVSSALR